jgi:O-antigen ligase
VDSAYGDAWNGAFVQKNEFARIIVLTGILILMRVRRTIAATGVIAISVGLIALCRSKTALVVFVAMLILLRIFRLRRWGSKALIAGIAGILLVTTLLSVAIDLDSMAGLLGRDSTLTGRTNIWAMALENIAERPVLGYGYNAFWNVAPGAERINTILHWKVPHAHNGFIDLTLQLGIVGLVLYIGIYFVAIRRALNLANETQEQEAIWPLTFVTFTLLYQVTESTILAGNTIIWMVFVSAICSVTQASEFETGDSTAPVLQNIGAFAADEELA